MCRNTKHYTPHRGPLGYSGGMNRATLKVKPATAARLRDAMPELAAKVGRMLTIDDAINALLDQNTLRLLAETGKPQR